MSDKLPAEFIHHVTLLVDIADQTERSLLVNDDPWRGDEDEISQLRHLATLLCDGSPPTGLEQLANLLERAMRLVRISFSGEPELPNGRCRWCWCEKAGSHAGDCLWMSARNLIEDVDFPYE